MERLTRRAALRTAIAGGIAALAGCSSGGGQTTYVTTTEEPRTTIPATGRFPATGTYRQFRYDDRKSGVAPGRGPREELQRGWIYEAGDKLHTSPAIVDGTVYVGDDATRLHAVDLETGEREWTHETNETPAYLIDASPAVADGTVVFAATTAKSDGTVHALDAGTGEPVWAETLERNARSSPVVADGSVYVGGGRGVYRLDLSTGEREWTVDPATEDGSGPAVGRVVGGVAYADGTVVAGTRGGDVVALDAETGKRRWTVSLDRAVQATPAVADGTVFVGGLDSTLHALSLSSGDRRWSFETGDWISTGVAVADGTVYLASQDGRVYAVRADDGSERWATAMGSTPTAAPVVAGDAVIVGTHPGGRAVALSRADGSERWSFDAGGSVKSPVSVVENGALVPSLDGNLYAIYG